MTEMWIARDNDGAVYVFSGDCFYDDEYKGWYPEERRSEIDSFMEIDSDIFSLRCLPHNERRRVKLTPGNIQDNTFLWLTIPRGDNIITMWNNCPRWNLILGCWTPALPHEDESMFLDMGSYFQDAGYGLFGLEVEIVSEEHIQEEEPTPNPEIYYCQECWKQIEDTPDNMATGLGLVCDCGNDSFYTQEEMDEIIEAFVDPEIFPVSCETCKWNEWVSEKTKVCFRVGGGVPCCSQDRYMWEPQNVTYMTH